MKYIVFPFYLFEGLVSSEKIMVFVNDTWDQVQLKYMKALEC